MIDDALIVQHIEPGRCQCCGGLLNRGWTPSEIVAAIHLWREKYGAVPKTEQWSVASPEHPSFKRVRDVFGSWNEAMRAAGITPRKQGGSKGLWTDEQIVAVMWDWARGHDGKPPTYEEWRHSTPEHPCSRIVSRRFGSWNAAAERAGFIARGPYGSLLRADLDKHATVDVLPVAEAVRAYGGWAKVADLVGVDEAGLRRALKRERMRLDYADRILTAISRPDVLAELEAA